MSFQSTTASATRLRASLAVLISWSIIRLLGPDIYALLTVIGIQRGWVELMLITISVMNAFAYYSSETPKSQPPNGPDSNSARRKSTGGLTFPSPAHRRLQGLTPRRQKSFPSSNISPSGYTSTPLSSINYRVASPLSQSFTSMSSTNSSPLAGYGPRGRHSMGGRSHPLDTSLLDRLMVGDSDDEEE